MGPSILQIRQKLGSTPCFGLFDNNVFNIGPFLADLRRE